LALLVAGVSWAGDFGPAKTCQTHPKRSGACFTVHARLSRFNGAPSARLWIIGTQRMLGVSEDRFVVDGYPTMPPEVAAKSTFDTDLFGDFLVCPFTAEKPGAMRWVCIESVEGLVVKPVRRRR
jgi:hypothetical protein